MRVPQGRKDSFLQMMQFPGLCAEMPGKPYSVCFALARGRRNGVVDDRGPEQGNRCGCCGFHDCLGFVSPSSWKPGMKNSAWTASRPLNAGEGTGGRKAVARRCPPLEGILLLVFCPHVRNAPASGKKARLFRSFIFQDILEYCHFCDINFCFGSDYSACFGMYFKFKNQRV